MDDDLLADDGQFKDDGLEDLDLDEEAALLGLSDEDIDNDKPANDGQELEYVDEDGNPVKIRKNNAGLYEVAPNRLGSSPDEDVLELDLDAELDSFTQENPDANVRESPMKSFNEKQCKENLISLTSLNDDDKKPQYFKKKESVSSPVIEIETSTVNIAYASKTLPSSNFTASESYETDDAEFDEESEDESMGDDHRERFKSERSNIITLTPAKKRADIPDTLDSVINVEETAKVQAFLENEQRRKMRFKGRPLPRMKSATYGRSPQPFTNRQPQQNPPAQFTTPQTSQKSLQPSQSVSSSQPRKILINPHFRGVRVPPTTTSESTPVINEAPLPAALPIPTYESSQNMIPPLYTHQDTVSQINVAPPVFSTPPLTTPYQSHDYPPPPQPAQQALPMWQPPPPEIPPPVSFPTPPPPVINYASQPPPNYHNNYNTNNYQNPNYQTPLPVPMQPATYNQPPPAVHMQPPAYTSPPVSADATHLHFQSSQANVQDLYHEQLKVSQPPTSHISVKPYIQNQHLNSQSQNIQHQNQHPQQLQNRPQQQNQHLLKQNVQPRQQNQHHRQQNQRQNQRFLRQTEKRPSNVNVNCLPVKQSRADLPLRTNKHVNNSNIREIPLVDTLPTVKNSQAEIEKKTEIVEEEDEETKMLRLQIEEQKLQREQVLKRKEMRRRQMAAQRLMELKKRQAQQTQTSTSVAQRPDASTAKQPVVQAQPKLSVKERIGLPISNTKFAGKKKVVVVRKKPIKVADNTVTAPPKKVINLGEKTTIQPSQNPQNTPVNKPPVATVRPTLSSKQVIKTTPPGKRKVISLQKTNKITKIEPPSPTPKDNVTKNNVSNSVKTNTIQNKKAPVLSRLGNRPRFQKKEFQTPHVPFQQRPRSSSQRFQGPRASQFQQPPFMDVRMVSPNPGPPGNDFRLPMTPPQFRERPPLLPFGPPGERPRFNQFMFEPNQPQFRPRGPGDLNHPHFFPPGMGDPIHPQLHVPGPRDASNHQFHSQGPGFQNFRPRGGSMFPPDRFPPPQFQNQMNQPRPMFEHNHQLFQQPRFHQGSNMKQRFSRSNFNQHRLREEESGNKNVTTISSNNPKSSIKVEDSGEKVDIKTEIPNPEPSNMDRPKTQTVSIENLSSSTNEGQLRKLCSAVGVIENIELIKKERKAIIKFKEVNQALNFHKKYQRYMLDLAMIQVTLVST